MYKNQTLLLAGIGLLAGLALLRSSRCTGNCRRVAQYMTGHSALRLVTLLAA